MSAWYRLLLCTPGAGEQAMLSGTVLNGIQTEEAKEVEDPMVEELGMIQSLQKPGALTAAINWYRHTPQTRKHMNQHWQKSGHAMFKH